MGFDFWGFEIMGRQNNGMAPEILIWGNIELRENKHHRKSVLYPTAYDSGEGKKKEREGIVMCQYTCEERTANRVTSTCSTHGTVHSSHVLKPSLVHTHIHTLLRHAALQHQYPAGGKAVTQQPHSEKLKALLLLLQRARPYFTHWRLRVSVGYQWCCRGVSMCPLWMHTYKFPTKRDGFPLVAALVWLTVTHTQSSTGTTSQYNKYARLFCSTLLHEFWF